MKAQNIDRTLSEVSDRLRQLRMKKGYRTAEEFSVRHGLPTLQYTRMEQGGRSITLPALLRVLAIHNVSLEDFFCDDYSKAAA